MSELWIALLAPAVSLALKSEDRIWRMLLMVMAVLMLVHVWRATF